MKLTREYYTLEEAADLIDDFSLKDIYHFIETGKIIPVLYTPKRRFIAMTRDASNKQRVAFATCSYRGLLNVHKRWIETLWDEKKIILNKSAVALNQSAITDWDSSNPFKGKSASSGFSRWIPTKYSDLEDTPLLLTPLPSENNSVAYTLQQFTIKVQPDYFDKNPHHNIQRYAYSFDLNGTFSCDDLRLLASHIKTLVKPDSEDSPQSPKQASKIASKSSLPWVDSQRGGSLVNEPLERLFRSAPNQPTRIYWRLLREGHERFDPDTIIDQVTNAEIHWYTRSDESKAMMYKTFENKISNIRKFYSENQIEIETQLA